MYVLHPNLVCMFQKTMILLWNTHSYFQLYSFKNTFLFVNQKYWFYDPLMGQGWKNTAVFLKKKSREGSFSFFSQLLTFPTKLHISQSSTDIILFDLTTILRDTFYKWRNWEWKILIMLTVIQPEFYWDLNPRSLTEIKNSYRVVSLLWKGEIFAHFCHSHIYVTVLIGCSYLARKF